MYKMVNNRYKHYYSDDPLDLGEAIWISHWFPNESNKSKKINYHFLILKISLVPKFI